MSILNFSYANIKDIDKFKQYIKAAAILMEESCVEIVVRGDFSVTMKGDNCAPHIAAVFRYPDKDAVDKFYTSEKYKAIIPLPDEAYDMKINLYKE